MSKADEMFKKGEKVIGKQNADNEVKKGKIYTISKVEGDFIQCKELEYGHFYFYFKHSADYLFEKIGFKKTRDCIDCWCKFIKENKLEISFEKNIKKIFIINLEKNDEEHCGFERINILSPELLQAINEKVKELGWLDE